MKSININWFLIPVVLLSNFLINSNSFSTTHTINVNNNFFTPPNLFVNVGDTIMWSWNQGNHTTTCNGSPNTSRPAGAAPWDAPMNSSNSTFKYVVTVEGTYNYKCFFHTGMVGTFNASQPVIALNMKLSYEGFWNGTINKADTAKVYLHSSSSPYAIVDSAKKNITTSSIVLMSFPNAVSGNYYIDVRHRNALQTWSQSPVAFTLGSNSNYDFTTAQAQAFGNNMILKLGRWCFFSGDVNHDEFIDVSDLSLIDNDVFNIVTGYVDTDVDGNTLVDLSDAAIVDNNGFNFVGTAKP